MRMPEKDHEDEQSVVVQNSEAECETDEVQIDELANVDPYLAARRTTENGEGIPEFLGLRSNAFP